MSPDCGILRLARCDDAAAMLAIYAPIVRETIISFELEPPSEPEMRERIEATLKMFPWLVEERDGRLAGYAYASAHRERKAYQWSVDVTCYVHQDFRGRGIGKRLYRALLSLLARQGFHAAFAGIALPNAASIALHESVGFRTIATYREVGYKAGGWRDTAWLQCTLGPALPDPPSPRPLASLGPRMLDDL
jgi:L-amino acid N-acyltransferase YncA